MTMLERVSRRLRFGSPIVVVSGLPRSGTSMMMQMLGAGGLPLMIDSQHAPDVSNPGGYYELDAVRDLTTGFDLSWLDVARDKAVKVHSPLLVCLPERYNYHVILMQRPLREVIASQRLMQARCGWRYGSFAEDPDVDFDLLAARYETHLRKVQALLAARPCFSALTVDYHDVLTDPHQQARRVRRFLQRPLSLTRMTAVVNARLYRSRPGDPEPEPATSVR
jgi:Sulfotransferase domain